ncbi:MAG TPA: adenylate/guanylate cyclase domain-containing protein, partial [Firmicutes bacterium]|nr:adenylate/guanylate cyclase domain-containing protein [Bacillota bacterium]
MFLSGHLINRLLITEAKAETASLILNGKRLKRLPEKRIISHPIKRIKAPVKSPEPFLPQGVLNFMKTQYKGEYRVVTVLFIKFSVKTPETPDISGLNTFFKQVIDITEKYRGSINKIDIAASGGKILILFGAPISHEHSAEYGLLTGMEIRSLKLRNISLSMGLSSGYVYAGIVGSDTAREYTVIGDTVNTAARLLDLKERSEIIISEKTQKDLQDRFHFKELNPVKVKGKRHFLKRYLPLSRKQEELYKFNFIGRQKEISEIKKASVSGFGVITLQGDPGIGKSRLLYELIQRLDSDVKVLRGTTEEIKGTYHIFATMIKTEARFSFEDPVQLKKESLDKYIRTLDKGRGELIRRIPYLGKMLFNIDYPGSIYDKVSAQLRFENLADALRLILEYSVKKSLLVILDDIQWISEKDMTLINHVIGILFRSGKRSAKISFLLSSRKDPDIIKHLKTPKGIKTLNIQLGAMTLEDIKALSAQLLNNKPVPDDVSRLLNNRAEGNPFFVEQYLMNLIERGALSEKKDKWVKTSLY